jgi:hypothetical protein
MVPIIYPLYISLITLYVYTYIYTCIHTWCGYEVPRMILLRDLEGAMRINRSKSMSLHVSTCTPYDFNALTPVMWKLWR